MERRIVRIKFNRDYGEYRVPGNNPRREEASSAYTDDLEDAIGTATHMHGADCDIYINRKHVFSTISK